MKKLQFKKDIRANAQKVYETMLGLKDKSTYEYWTKSFNPTSTFEGSWNKGNKILFTGVDENGKRGGMVSKVVDNQVAQFVSVIHIGFVDGDVEVTSGELVEKWAGGHENYTFSEHDGITSVTVELDTVEEYVEYFNNTYPMALDKLREIAEK